MSRRFSIPLWTTYAMGLAALASCVDPFGFDPKPVGDTAGAGGQSAATGSTGATQGPATGSSGPATGSSTGTSTSQGNAAAATGSGSASTSTSSTGSGSVGAGGGSSGAGGVAIDAGRDASEGTSGAGGGGGAGGKAGSKDGGITIIKSDAGPNLASACPTNRFYPPIPDGGEATCPPRLADLQPWLPTTPPVVGCTPLPHPGSDCPFYFFSWQNFMIASQPDAMGRPAFLQWGTIENTFNAGAGMPPPTTPFLGGGVTQAGGRQVLIDQNGHAVYYAIHMNKAFTDFVNAQGLQTTDGIVSADPNMQFPSGLVETKEAWMVVPDNAPPADYIISRVQVPTLHLVNGQIVEDRGALRNVTVALLAMHIVFTLPGHPEFIWSTFHHVNAQAIGDIAPVATDNAENTPANTVIARANFPLFRNGTTAATGNRGIQTLTFDDAAQTFPGQQTSIYRAFPASKSNTIEGDGDIGSINDNMTARFASAQQNAMDRRSHYRLVGAIWQDRPQITMNAPDKVLTNDETDPDIIINGADSLRSLVAGEDRLSSVAMESFTQGADSFPNCFTCHDTRSTSARGVPTARDVGADPLLQPKLINVSHIFNEVIRLHP